MDYTYSSTAASAGDFYSILASIGIGIMIVALVVSVLMIVSLWKIYTKAGKPGWASLIPVYTNIVMLEIVKLEWWHVLIMIFVPFAVVVYNIIIAIKLANLFGKSGGFAVLLILLPIIGYPMLAFGSAEYKG